MVVPGKWLKNVYAVLLDTPMEYYKSGKREQQSGVVIYSKVFI